MNINDLLSTTNHRPWSIPSRSWGYYQEWNNVVFLHWQVDLDQLKKFVPEDLEIDLFEGKPWVSVVAFTMEKIRPKYLPAFPPISNFDEINIRTYVKSGHKTGVYFLSIEGGTKLSCQIAKGISGLPYRYSHIKRGEGQYNSENEQYNDRLAIEFNIGKEKTDLSGIDNWLTARYALYQDSNKKINEFEIHHLEWGINEIDILQLDLSYSRFAQLISDKPHVAHYSDGVKVIAWDKQ